jgi:hypothetical protein
VVEAGTHTYLLLHQIGLQEYTNLLHHLPVPHLPGAAVAAVLAAAEAAVVLEVDHPGVTKI